MARAYLKIYVDGRNEERTLEDLLQIEGVKMADLTMGEQDIIALIEADSFDDIVQIVLGQVRRIAGISRTVTNLAVSYR
jgi:uncharacterized protein with GYD domain